MSRHRLRVGVIGTGLIAQIMHLPYLSELEDLFEVRALCDGSRMVLAHCGQRFGVDRRFTVWEQLIEEDLDAVLVLTSGSHAPPAIAAAAAGMHVLVEKPMCFSTTEGAAMLEAAARSDTVLMVGYPKRHDPAYQHARAAVERLDDLRFVRVTTLESPAAPYFAHHNVIRGDDIGSDQAARWRAETERSIDEAIGRLLDEIRPSYKTVLLDTVCEGDCLGEVAIFHPSQASATVTGLAAGELWIIDAGALQEFLLAWPNDGCAAILGINIILSRRLKRANGVIRSNEIVPSFLSVRSHKHALALKNR